VERTETVQCKALRRRARTQTYFGVSSMKTGLMDSRQ